MYALCVSGAVNTQGFVWKFFYALYINFHSFIHCFGCVRGFTEVVLRLKGLSDFGVVVWMVHTSSLLLSCGGVRASSGWPEFPFCLLGWRREAGGG